MSKRYERTTMDRVNLIPEMSDARHREELRRIPVSVCRRCGSIGVQVYEGGPKKGLKTHWETAHVEWCKGRKK